METSELIQNNNHKRNQLTKENRKYYEDILVYIRLNAFTSTLETEEVLTELLDHLLEVQKKGKTAADIFGDHPQKYADEIVSELPKMTINSWILLITMSVLYFLAVITTLNGLIGLFSHYVLNIEELVILFHLGSLIFQMILSIFLALALVYIMLVYLRWSCFKKIRKVLEFFGFWLYGLVSIGLFIVIILFTPIVGQSYEISMFTLTALGVVLFALAYVMQKVQS